jgi:hypothetical protein
VILPNIPPRVYDARPILKSIREEAHRRLAGADAVLWSVLVQVAAHIPARVSIDTGIGAPIRPTLYAAMTETSGGGKSIAWQVSRKLVPDLPEPSSLSTGEGAIEAFYGKVLTEQVQLPDKNGEPRPAKLVWMRQRVRDNVMFYLDEGEVFFRQLDRPGNVVAPILRSLWSGGTVGQANASEETRRSLDAGTYSAGLIVGLQPDISGRLLADTSTGTAQRFVWVAARDRYLVDDAPVWTTALPIAPLQWTPPTLPGTPSPLKAFMDQPSPGQAWKPPPELPGVSVMLDPTIVAGLRAHQVALRRGDVEPDEHDTQRPAMHVKVAAVLAWLDGRLRVTVEDWAIAAELLATSDAVRSGLLEHAAEVVAADREARGVERAEVDQARDQADVRRREAQQKIIELLTDADDAGMTHGEINQKFSRALRPHLGAVIAAEQERGTIIVERAHSGGRRYTLVSGG